MGIFRYGVFSILLFFNFLPTISAKLSKTARSFIVHHSLADGAIKQILDQIFMREKMVRVALERAGFIFIRDGKDQIVAEHPDVPGYLVKAIPEGSSKSERFTMHVNVDRLRYAEEINTIIQQEKFEGIVVPRKYFYHIPGRGEKLKDKNYFVVVEKLDLLSEQKSSEVLRRLPNKIKDALCFIIAKVGLSDVHPGNIVVTQQGDVAFIDTELRRSLIDIPLLGALLNWMHGMSAAKRFSKKVLHRSVFSEHDSAPLKENVECKTSIC